MKLLVIYGPQGVGKETVAKAICSKTDFTFMPGHPLYLLAASLFKEGSKEYTEYYDSIRFNAFEIAAKTQQKGMVYTCAFGHPKVKEFTETTRNLIKPLGGKLHLLKLKCELDTLRERVKSESRIKANKITDYRKLQQSIEVAAPYRAEITPDVVIDSTNLKAAAVADQTINHFNFL